MKTTKKLNLIFFIFISIFIILNSCEFKPLDEFFQEQFPETNIESAEIIIDGQAAVPILNTSLRLSNILPNMSDSTYWLEIDNDKLIHLHMYHRDLANISPDEMGIGVIFPGPVTKDSIQFNTDSNSFQFFKLMFDGQLFFSNPKITLILFNQMPINLFLRIDSLNFLSSIGYERMSQTRKHYIIKGDGVNFTETRIVFDKNSEGFSNFPNMFTPIPNNFSLGITSGLDVDTNYSGDGSEQLKLDVDFDLPLELRINDLVLTDTFPFTLDSTDTPIEALTLKIIFNNEFPFGGKTDIFFTDTNSLGQANNIIVNLFGNDGWEFDAGVTNTAGETISPTKSSITITLSKEQLDSLIKFKVSKLIFKSALNTYNSSSGQNVKIFTFYKIGIQVGAKIDYSVNVLDMMNN